MNKANTSVDLPVPVLVYHAVEDRLTPDITTTGTLRFRRQMLGWRHQDVRILTMAEYVSRRGRQQPGERLLLLTFDDGYALLEDFALPLLEQLKYPATIFPVLGFSGRDNDWDPARFNCRRRHLDHQQLAGLERRGFTIGNHSLTHCDSSRLTPVQLVAEWLEAHQQLATIGINAPVAAWPFGRSCAVARELLADSGYQVVFALAAGNEWPWQVPRLSCYRYTGAPLNYDSLLATYRGSRLLQRIPGAFNRLSGLFQKCSQKTLGVKETTD